MPGEWARYYTGDLAGSRTGGSLRALRIADTAFRLYGQGRFGLFQRRPKASPPSVFDYLIVCYRTAYQKRLQDGKVTNRTSE